MKNRVCVKPLPSHQSDFGHVLRGRVSLYRTIRFLFITPIHALYLLSSTANHCRDDFSAFLFPSELSLSINDMSCECSVYANKYIIKWEKKLHTTDGRRRRHENGTRDCTQSRVGTKKKNQKEIGLTVENESAEKCLSLDAGKEFFGVVPSGIAGRRQCLNKNQMRVRCEVPIMCLFIDIMTLWCQAEMPSSAFGNARVFGHYEKRINNSLPSTLQKAAQDAASTKWIDNCLSENFPMKPATTKSLCQCAILDDQRIARMRMSSFITFYVPAVLLNKVHSIHSILIKTTNKQCHLNW